MNPRTLITHYIHMPRAIFRYSRSLLQPLWPCTLKPLNRREVCFPKPGRFPSWNLSSGGSAQKQPLKFESWVEGLRKVSPTSSLSSTAVAMMLLKVSNYDPPQLQPN